MIRFDRVRLSEGTVQGAITGITQDEKGFMWFGTRNGLYRYDGERFLIFRHIPGDDTSISNDVINTLGRGADNKIWVCTNKGGIDRFDPISGTFHHFRLSGGEQAPEEPPIAVEALHFDHQQLPVLLTEHGRIYRFDTSGQRFTPMEIAALDGTADAQQFISRVFIDKRGWFWLSLAGNRHLCIDPESGDPVDYENIRISTEALEALAFWVLEDATGLLWGNYKDGEIVSADLKTGNVSIIPPADGPESLFLEAACEDSSGLFWLGTIDKGLLVYNRSDGSLAQFVHAPNDFNSLTSNSITAIFEDAAENIWIGTKEGLVKFSRFRFKFEHLRVNSEIDGRGANALSIFEDSSGTLWLGTLESGLFKIDRGVQQRIAFSDVSDADFGKTVQALFEDTKGNFYVGLDEGLFKLDRNSNSLLRLTPPQQITDIIEDRNGIIWISSYVNGFASYDDGTGDFSFFSLRGAAEAGGKTYDATTLFEDSNGNLWVGFDGDGVIKLSPDRIRYQHFKHKENSVETLSDDHVLTILEDSSGSIWLGTRYGLNRYDLEAETFTRYHAGAHLPDNVVCGILSDADGHLWISTYNGLARFYPIDETSIKYDVGDGLQDNYFNPGAYYKSQDGTIYFGGVNGVNRFNPHNLEVNRYIPNVEITSFRVLNQEQLGAGDTPVYHIPFDQNFFSFEFAVLDFTEPTKNQFSYKLVGHDEEWTVTTLNQASYSRVSPGEYTFHVNGANSDGIWNQEGAGVKIIVIPPLWMRVEFQIFLASVIVAAIIGIYQLRTRAIKHQSKLLQQEVDKRRLAQGRLETNQARLRSLASKLTIAEEGERRNIAQMLHDQIGQSLMMSMVKLDNVAERHKEFPAVDELEHVVTMLDTTIRDARSLTVQLSPPSLHKFGLEAAIESFVDKFNKDHNINTVVMRGKDSKVSKEVSVLLYQATRELLFNVFKHAQASSVVVKLDNDGTKMLIRVKDNGIGFNSLEVIHTTDDLKGFGLYSIFERLESVGGTMTITSSPGSGTEVTLSAPLRLSEKQKQEEQEK